MKNNGFEKKQEADKLFVDSLLNTILKGGLPPWRKNWTTTPTDGSYFEQKNPVTGTVYGGINWLRLFIERGEKGYTSSNWYTFNNVKDLGHSIEKGSEGVPVYKWTEWDKLTKKAPDWVSIRKMPTSEQVDYLKKNVYTAMSYSSSVFNEDCIKDFKKEPLIPLTSEQIDIKQKETSIVMETIIKNNTAPLYFGGNECYYVPSTHTIHLPLKVNFQSIGDFYGVYAHEAGHAVKKDLNNQNRDNGRFGSAAYAMEELNAELSSLFLIRELEKVGADISLKTIENSAAYLKGWGDVAKVFKAEDGYKEFYKSVSEAEKRAKYIFENFYERVAVSAPQNKENGLKLLVETNQFLKEDCYPGETSKSKSFCSFVANVQKNVLEKEIKETSNCENIIE